MDRFLEICKFAKKSATVEEFMEGCGATYLPDNDEDIKLYKEFHVDGRSEEQAAEMVAYEITKNSCNCAYIITHAGSPYALTNYLNNNINYATNMATLKTASKSKPICFCVSQMVKIGMINRGAKCYYVSMNYCDGSTSAIGCIPAIDFWKFLWNLFNEIDSFDNAVKSISEYICNKIEWKKAENLLKIFS